MATLRINNSLVVDYTVDGWAEYKKWLDGTYAALRFVYAEQPSVYDIAAPDGDVCRLMTLNKTDASDFETNFRNRANAPIEYGAFDDPRLINKFGNLTATSTSEVLVSARPYAEPASQAQRSVVSTSNQDKPGGSGSAAVRITFLNSDYVLKTEDVTLNGNQAVDMVATDLRFVEDMRVIQGAEAAGAIKLMTATGGGGTEIAGIGAATENAFLCHHYVPAGKRAYVLCWEASIDDECNMKLKGQHWYNGNLVIENWDLRKMFGIATPPGRIETCWDLKCCPMDEKTRAWITVTPNQTTSTVIRTHLCLWEE